MKNESDVGNSAECLVGKLVEIGDLRDGNGDDVVGILIECTRDDLRACDLRMYGDVRIDNADSLVETDFMPGERVEIQKQGLPENGKIGTVKAYDPESGFYFVEFEQGPPWRGFYEVSEMFNAAPDRTADKGCSVQGMVDPYQPLFDYLHDELGAHLQEIIEICLLINADLTRSRDKAGFGREDGCNKMQEEI